jgi:hypothetical protein
MVASISTNTVNIPQQSTNRKRDGRKSIYNGLFLLIMCITHQLLPASIRVSTKFTSNDCMSASDTKPKRKNLNDTPQYPKDRYCEPERGSEWEPIKILLEGEGCSNKTNTASDTRLRLTTQIGQVHVATGVLLNL